MKKIFKISLLTIFLSLIFLFSFAFSNKSKAYYDEDMSRVYVYINGSKSLISYFDDMKNFSQGVGLNKNGWPSVWMTNDYTKNMTFDQATYDLNGENICNSYGDFYDRWMSAFSYEPATGYFTTEIYLWFHDSATSSNYCDIKFIYTRSNYIYEPIEMKWNCSNPFTFSDFPDGFLNLNTYEYDKTVGGSWYEYPGSNICNSEYSAYLIGGESYTYEFYVSPYLEDVYESYLTNLEIKDVMYAHEERILLPRYTNGTTGYEIVWELTDGPFVEFGRFSDYNIPLVKIQDIESATIVSLIANLTIDGLRYERNFTILLEAKGGYLETPVLTKEINSIAGITTLVWDPIVNADYYELAYVRDGVYTLLATLDSSTTRYKLPGAIEDLDDYYLVVRACSKLDEYYNPSNYSESVYFRYDSQYERLTAPTLSLNDHLLKWNSISYCSGYYLYCDDSLVAILPGNQLQYDLYNLDLAVGEHVFRIVAIPDNYDEFDDSPYSNKVTYEEIEKGIGFNYNNDKFKYIAYKSLSGVTDLKIKESLNAAIPTELNLSTGIAIVTKYYLDKEMTLEISKDSIFEQWKNQKYRYMDLYVDVVQPLVYEGPKVIYKNPSGYLKTSDIEKIVDDYCKSGTNGTYILDCVEDKYTGFADEPGTYTMKFECNVDGYITTIDITIKVSSTIKADYIYNNKWFSRSIISQEDIISTAKVVGVLPDVTLNGFKIVTLHNEYKTDYYGSKPSYGAYNFMINYESHSGAAGLVQFEVNYLTPSGLPGEEKPAEFPIGTVIAVILVVAVGIGAVVFVTTYKKSKKYKYKRKGGF